MDQGGFVSCRVDVSSRVCRSRCFGCELLCISGSNIQGEDLEENGVVEQLRVIINYR